MPSKTLDTGTVSPLGIAEPLAGELTTETSRGRLKNHLFVALAVIANTLGNFLLTFGMRAMDFKLSASPSDYIRFFGNPWIDVGVILLIVWLVAQLTLLSWADLSYVLPITAGSYVLTAVLGKFFLSESISIIRWSGILLISAGVMAVIGTSPKGRLGPREIIP